MWQWFCLTLVAAFAVAGVALLLLMAGGALAIVASLPAPWRTFLTVYGGAQVIIIALAVLAARNGKASK